MFQNVSQIWSTTAGFEGFAGAGFQLIRNEKKVINNNNSPYTFWNRARAYIPIYFPTSRINVGCVYLENFQKFSPRIRSRRGKIASTVVQRVTKSTHTMLQVYPKENASSSTTSRRPLPKRKAFLSSDELGLDLSAIFNPILEIRNCIQPPPLRT